MNNVVGGLNTSVTSVFGKNETKPQDTLNVTVTQTPSATSTPSDCIEMDDIRVPCEVQTVKSRPKKRVVVVTASQTDLSKLRWIP